VDNSDFSGQRLFLTHTQYPRCNDPQSQSQKYSAYRLLSAIGESYVNVVMVQLLEIMPVRLQECIKAERFR
jgi:hypothetical protein